MTTQTSVLVNSLLKLLSASKLDRDQGQEILNQIQAESTSNFACQLVEIVKNLQIDYSIRGLSATILKNSTTAEVLEQMSEEVVGVLTIRQRHGLKPT